VRIIARTITLTDIIRTNITVVTGIGGSRTDSISAGVRMGAGITIVTTGGVIWVRTGPIAKTDIIGTNITIVTDIGRTSTGTIRTGVRMCTGYTVITAGRIVWIIAGPVAVFVQATKADVIRTDVTIIAGIGRTATGSIRAHICVGAYGIIIAYRVVRFGGIATDTGRRITDPSVMALVKRCTRNGRLSDTSPQLTGVVGSTEIAIVARGRVVRVVALPDTSAIRRSEAYIIGTNVTVVTGIGRPSTDPIFKLGAGVSVGTRIGVITGKRVRRIGTRSITVTFVVGTGVVVYTVVGDTITGSASADIVLGASHTIITGQRVIWVRTRPITLTNVVRADIPIIADIARAYAGSSRTGVCMGTDITIVTGHGIIRVRTGTVAIADVVRTNITIVAGIRRTSTYSSTTGVRMGAGITIVTASGVVNEIAGAITKTDIIGADVIIITDIACTRTNTIGAGVRMSTRDVVITGRCIIGEGALSYTIRI